MLLPNTIFEVLLRFVDKKGLRMKDHTFHKVTYQHYKYFIYVSVLDYLKRNLSFVCSELALPILEGHWRFPDKKSIYIGLLNHLQECNIRKFLIFPHSCFTRTLLVMFYRVQINTIWIWEWTIFRTP